MIKILTTEMLKPLIDGITANVGVILPACLAIFGIIFVIKLIPSIIRKFDPYYGFEGEPEDLDGR